MPDEERMTTEELAIFKRTMAKMNTENLKAMSRELNAGLRGTDEDYNVDAMINICEEELEKREHEQEGR